ncbi:MAG: hypothetical protein DRP11_02130 [Candidatus Aenigmatarchaeota archaeon]|nr:MAG: hypothetical protein DRP11_02130 [Candidatus Aenigmarchaeota archaeon]
MVRRYDPSLVLYLPLEEGSGNIAHDVSGSGNHGTVYGASWVDGRFGKALSFDGDDYVEVAHDSSLAFTSEDFTLTAWIYPTIVSGDQEIITKGRYEEDGYYFVLDTNGRLWLQINQNLAHQSTYSYADISANNWYFVCAIRNGTLGYIYINGVDRTEVQENITNPTTNTRTLKIGRYDSEMNYFHGIIDEVRIYSRVLTQLEINLLYNTGVLRYTSVPMIARKVA